MEFFRFFLLFFLYYYSSCQTCSRRDSPTVRQTSCTLVSPPRTTYFRLPPLYLRIWALPRRSQFFFFSLFLVLRSRMLPTKLTCLLLGAWYIFFFTFNTRTVYVTLSYRHSLLHHIIYNVSMLFLKHAGNSYTCLCQNTH